MKALPVIAFGVSAIVANLVGRGNADPPATTTTATAAATAPASPHDADDCRGGQEDRVTVKLDPDEILEGRGGERIAIGVHVHPHFEGPAALVGAVEVIDDRGRRIGAARELGLRSLAARSPATYRIETPDQLRDGYYRVQVSVLARARDAEAAEDFSTHQLYFHVAGGSITPVTSAEWLTRSESGLAFTSP